MFAALVLPSLASAGEDKPAKEKPAQADVDKRILTASDIQKYLTPYAADIGACYKKHALKQKAATGDMKLELIVHRNGSVFRIHVVAPGVKGKSLSKCVTGLSKKWSFPPRKGFTHALIPFFYLKTAAKGAGPLESCWSPKGCHKKRKAQRSKYKKKSKKVTKPPAKAKGDK